MIGWGTLKFPRFGPTPNQDASGKLRWPIEIPTILERCVDRHPGGDEISITKLILKMSHVDNGKSPILCKVSKTSQTVVR